MKNVSVLSLKGCVSVLVLFSLCVYAAPASAFPSSQPAATAPVAAAQAPISGKVVEAMNAGGYTYVCLEKNQQKTWVALPSMTVAVGDELSVHPGNQMGPFTSKTLNRTFDKIIFSGGPMTASSSPTPAAPAAMPAGHPTLPASATAMPAGHPGTPATGNLQTSSPVAQGTSQLSGLVVETFDAGGYTYLLLQEDGLEGWAAVPPVQVKVGDEVAVRPGMDMGEFTSKTLNRTFSNIIFSPGLVTE